MQRSQIFRNNVLGIGNIKFFWAVNGVSFTLNPGEAFGLIGESGSGKTTVGKIIAGLYPKIEGGYVKFENSDKSITEFSNKEMKKYREKVQMVFQHPEASLNPQMKVIESIKEAIRLNSTNKNTKNEIKDLISKFLHEMQLKINIDSYPDELSGGEKRRIGLIRTLALEPKLIIADEPFSGLDASVRNNIVNLLAKRIEGGMSLILISHDMDVVNYLCPKIGVMYDSVDLLPFCPDVTQYVVLSQPAIYHMSYDCSARKEFINGVMYKGKLVEKMEVNRGLFNEVKHPYTKMLLNPSKNYGFNNTLLLKDSVCSFIKKCYIYNKLGRDNQEICEKKEFDNSQKILCHFWDKG